MTTSLVAGKESGWFRQMRGAAGWLTYAASPAFGLMTLVTASDAGRTGLCSAGSGMLPIDGMTMMYLLMSLFHLAPWLKLASTAGRASNR